MSRMSALRDSAARSSAVCARSPSARSVLRRRPRCSSDGAGSLELGQRALACDDAVAIELGQDGQNAGRLSNLTNIRRGEKQAQIASLAQLVDVDQPRAQLRTARRFLLLEVLHPPAVRRQLGGDLRAVRDDLPKLLRLDLALDLELPQVAEQRAFFSCQAVGFLPEHLEPVGGALRQRLGSRPVRRLGQQDERQHGGEQESEGQRRAACHRST